MPQNNNLQVEATRNLMQQLKTATNQQAMLNQILQGNPAIANLVRSGGSLEAYARQMAASKGIDINWLLKQLQGGM